MSQHLDAPAPLRHGSKHCQAGYFSQKAAEKLRNWGITFDGATDPISFIQHLEERATAYEVNVVKMPQAIPGLLTDTAEHWFRTSQLLGESRKNFKKAFLDFFLAPRYF